jgi:hypothetical protein
VLSGGPELRKGAFLLGLNPEKYKEITVYIHSIDISV